MGFLDALLGGRKKLKGVAPDRLFAMSTAYVAFQTALDIGPSGRAGIVFQPLGTADFGQIVKDAEELLHATARDAGARLESADDEFGYRWLVLHDSDFEDLVVSLNTISTELQAGGYGDRLLCAVFAFDEGDRRLYFIYNFKRGAFYPFVPGAGDRQRDTERELRLRAQAADELPLEPETSRWFPLWQIPL